MNIQRQHGEPRLHRFDHTGRIKPRLEMWRGHSTVTLLFEVDGDTYALLSGHAMPPVREGSFVRSFDGEVRPCSRKRPGSTMAGWSAPNWSGGSIY